MRRWSSTACAQEIADGDEIVDARLHEGGGGCFFFLFFSFFLGLWVGFSWGGGGGFFFGGGGGPGGFGGGFCFFFSLGGVFVFFVFFLGGARGQGSKLSKRRADIDLNEFVAKLPSCRDAGRPRRA